MLLNSLAISSKLLASFGVLKLISITFSHSDLSDYYLIQNQVSVLQFIFSFGLINGFLNESVKNNCDNDIYLLLKISTVLFLLILPLAYLFSGGLGCTIVFSSFLIAIKSTLYSILNGQRKKKDYTLFVFFEMLLILSVIKIVYDSYGIQLVILSQGIISAFVVFLVLYRLNKLDYRNFLFVENSGTIKSFVCKYLPYFKMAVVSAFVVPLIYLLARNILFGFYDRDSLNLSILFASWRLSDSLLIGIGALSSIYIIPELNRNQSINSFLYRMSLFIALVLLLALILLVYFPDFIVSSLLDKKYTANFEIILTVFLSFFLRAISYVLGLKLVYLKKTKSFVSIEIGHAVTFLVCVLFFSLINASVFLVHYAFLFQGIVCLTLTYKEFYLSSNDEI
ncbi:hypothetical protein [Vibrio nigripulchritudo]|uniref:hypothetical protein n=1 Tax=Vibrio nigripulchritudo TaxID=28173 RepID=UPI0003B1C588|nr:hypothetical protein [Vibrio nigripulchritudo]CCN70271.1 membrane hypothetical protein [Vibrio nigripulchritudo SFn118]